MKYLFQFALIMLFVFLGELMAYLLPLPIAGSIYGLILLFLALWTGIVKLTWVEDVVDWLHGIMALFFVAPAVAIIDVWGEISNIWPVLLLLLVVAYMVTMITTGLTSDALIDDVPKHAKNKKSTTKKRKVQR